MFINRAHNVVSASSDEVSDSEVNAQSSIITRVLSPFSFANIRERSSSETLASGSSLVYPNISSSCNA